MLKLDFLPTGPLGVNCSLVWDPAAGTGVIVDPGGHGARIQARVAQLGFRVEGVLLTHAHFDHVGAARDLQRHYGVKVHLHPGDDALLASLPMQVEAFGMDPIPLPDVTPLADGEELHGLKVIHTPGHTPGGCCFLGTGERGPILSVGDTLFAGGVGRTDLWGGSWDDLERSIRTRLYTLDDATFVVPGHGPATTIGEEAETNPFVSR